MSQRANGWRSFEAEHFSCATVKSKDKADQMGNACHDSEPGRE